MAKYPEEILRETGIGTWGSMPPVEMPELNPRDHAQGLGKRLSPDILWRVSTRHEMVEHFHSIVKISTKAFFIAVVSLLAAFYTFYLYVQTKDLLFAFFAIAFAAVVSRNYTKALGNYAGGWSDYEHDPVQVLPHNAYVLGKRHGLI